MNPNSQKKESNFSNGSKARISKCVSDVCVEEPLVLDPEVERKVNAWKKEYYSKYTDCIHICNDEDEKSRQEFDREYLKIQNARHSDRYRFPSDKYEEDMKRIGDKLSADLKAHQENYETTWRAAKKIINAKHDVPGCRSRTYKIAEFFKKILG